ncbi:hypothetical protein DPMN_113268 [Dreissena polymorpha]|uniref:Uncharacterized protein n=1 Tax=Dreissena polymorpha TaxID=45954 RepID=A0A9D4KIS0_DREPO|nr:hypothetical protein DPMN_113268 [Dreissena polymorpha]
MLYWLNGAVWCPEYTDLMQRLQEYLGAMKLPATAHFQIAHQETGESLDNWSDRVLTLATKAFRDLPSTYSSQQAVARFCQGLSDKEASSKHLDPGEERTCLVYVG